jgi:SagB-type dehydrogenase family enzyme
MKRPLDEEFHVASRNPAFSKQNYAAHLIHYAPHIEQLAADAPLHLGGPAQPGRAAQAPALAMSLETVLQSRKSSRDFGGRPIAAADLWKLCYVASGVREAVASGEHVWFQRNVPNSGGLGSIEVFPVVLNVEGLASGIYHFDSVSHAMIEIATGDFREWLAKDVVFQDEFASAAAAIVLVGCFERLRTKYGIRGYRSVLIDAGHCSENIYLAATALSLNVCATTGFVDDEVDEALRIDGVDMASLVVLLVGAPPGRDVR